MDYSYVATGGLQAYGCSHYHAHYVYITKFNVGDVVYSVPAARKGVLEKIAIRKIKIFPIPPMPAPGGLGRLTGNSPLYTDSFNSLYNEDDLCDLDTANDLIEQYTVHYEALQRWIAQHC